MPKAKLLLIGGAEDKGPIRNPPIIKEKNRNYVDYDVLSHLIELENPFHDTIEVITTASQQPVKTGNMYIRSFKKAGFSHVRHMNIENKDDLKNTEFVERVKAARVVFFSGGDQSRLVSILGGSELMKVVYDRFENDAEFTLAGTSAGAMAMSEHMIYHAENNEAMLKGHVKITQGFCIMKRCIIDTHFVKRGRYGRLFQAALMNPGNIAIGLGEDTGILVQDNVATCVGSGMAVVIDTSHVSYSSLDLVEENEPVSAENMIVHLLTRGDRFNFGTWKMMPKSISVSHAN